MSDSSFIPLVVVDFLLSIVSLHFLPSINLPVSSLVHTSNTVNEPLPTTAAGVNKNAALQDYQKFVSMSDLDRSNAAKQMSQRDKNMVMIGASQINNTINERSIITGAIKQRQQQQQQINATTSRGIMIGSFIITRYS
jgi:hypothetical protein